MATLRAAGWRIEEADVAWPDDTTETAFAAVNSSASALLYGEQQAADKDLFGDNVTGLIERGRSVPGTDVVAAFRFADACARSVAQFFTEYDYLLTPTTACVSWPVEQVYPKIIENKEVGPRGHAAFTPLFNLALVPGISIPCGTGRDGLPVGLQIVAPRLHDRPLLAMAQRARDGARLVRARAMEPRHGRLRLPTDSSAPGGWASWSTRRPRYVLGRFATVRDAYSGLNGLKDVVVRTTRSGWATSCSRRLDRRGARVQVNVLASQSAAEQAEEMRREPIRPDLQLDGTALATLQDQARTRAASRQRQDMSAPTLRSSGGTRDNLRFVTIQDSSRLSMVRAIAGDEFLFGVATLFLGYRASTGIQLAVLEPGQSIVRR